MTDADCQVSQLTRDAFEAIAWLDPPLLVGHSAAGTSYNVTIARKATVLTLPAKGPDELGGGEDKPIPRIPEFPRPPLAEPIVRGAWMQISSRAVLRERPLIVEAIRLRWKDRARTSAVRKGDHFGPDFDKDLGPWLALARDWLTVWRGGVRRPMMSEVSPQIRMASSAYGGSIGGGGFAPPGVYLERRQISTPGEVRAAWLEISPSARPALARAGRPGSVRRTIGAWTVVTKTDSRFR